MSEFKHYYGLFLWPEKNLMQSSNIQFSIVLHRQTPENQAGT
jgi:hypothetical protein